MKHSEDRAPKYQENSLTLTGAVALGTGVMIGAGIFALTGQMIFTIAHFIYSP